MHMSKRLIAFALVVMMIFTSSIVLADTSSPVITKLTASNTTVARTVNGAEYDGTKKTATLAVTVAGTTLKQGTDYTISGNVTSGVNPGTYTLTVTITGVGYYTGSVTKKISYSIYKASQTISFTGRHVVYVKASDLAKKAQTVSATATTGNKTKLVYSAGSKITVSSNGTVKLPKGLKKGMYRITVRAQATTQYKASNVIYFYVVVR